MSSAQIVTGMFLKWKGFYRRCVALLASSVVSVLKSFPEKV
jgi:hypothetical protein